MICLASLGTKTLVVHGQNECDIPTQLPVHEDTQFEALLKVGMAFNRNDFLMHNVYGHLTDHTI